jgi:hypothetical protein
VDRLAGVDLVGMTGVGLPLVDGAVAAGEGVGLGILKSVQDGLVLGVEGNAGKESAPVFSRSRCYQFENIFAEKLANLNQNGPFGQTLITKIGF